MSDQPPSWLEPPPRPDLPPPRPDQASSWGTPWPPDSWTAQVPPSGPAARPAPAAAAERPKADWSWWLALLIFIGGIFLSGLVGVGLAALVKGGGMYYIVGILGEFLPMGLLLLWLNTGHVGWQAVIGFPARFWKEVGVGVIGGLAVYGATAIGVGMALYTIFHLITGRDVSTPEQLPGELSGIRLVLAFVLVVVAAPIAEEFFFRGCLFGAMRSRAPFWLAAVGSSVVFGLAHWDPGSETDPVPVADALLLVTMMFFVGCGLAYVYEKRGNIVACMAAHATFNLLGLGFIVLGVG